MVKLITYLFPILVPFFVFTQTKVVRYFDKSWEPTESQKSMYTAEFIKDGENYTCIFYWTGTSTVAGKGTYLDTTVAKPIGLLTGYFRNGAIEDSNYYDKNGSLLYQFHYYKNGKLEVHYQSSGDDKQPIIEAFDENGKKIKNYIFSKEAQFRGGDAAWKKFIAKTVNNDLRIPGKEGLSVTVKILFAINEMGNTSSIKVIESSGVKQVDADAARVILSSPAWDNAIYLNKPVKAYRIQPITYVLSTTRR